MLRLCWRAQIHAVAGARLHERIGERLIESEDLPLGFRGKSGQTSQYKRVFSLPIW
jgi:hypothetical protein